MDITGRDIWQHSAGDWAHRHDKICKKWGVILSGGPNQLKDQMKCGHIVVLRLGLTTLVGVGVLGEYEEYEEFSDIDGWDLRYTRRVNWLWWPDDQEKFDGRVFQQGTTKRLRSPPVIEKIKAVLSTIDGPVDCDNVEPFDFSEDTKLDVEEISAYLFNKGLPGDSIRNLLDRHSSFSRMTRWYKDEHKDKKRWASEHETVCHLVVPLLRVLGWTPQRIGLEYDRIDAALFARLPRNNESLSAVVEAKRVHGACLTAVSQARTYATRYRNCSRIIVTDGLRYGVYVRKGNEWPPPEVLKPYAYLNLWRPREKYPVYGDLRGAKEAIFAMTPEYILEQ